MPLLHLENATKLVQFKLDQYPISTTIKLSPREFELEVNALPASSIILSPAYDEDNKGIEIQMCITGKMKYGETPAQAIVREIAEEIGFNLDEKKITIKEYNKRFRTTYFSAIELTPDKLIETPIIPLETEDNYQQTVCCLLYLKKENWLGFIERKIHQRKRIASSDVAGVNIVCSSKEEIQIILNKWSKNEIKFTDRYNFRLEK
jgi:hypothetical protein